MADNIRIIRCDIEADERVVRGHRAEWMRRTIAGVGSMHLTQQRCKKMAKRDDVRFVRMTYGVAP